MKTLSAVILARAEVPYTMKSSQAEELKEELRDAIFTQLCERLTPFIEYRVYHAVSGELTAPAIGEAILSLDIIIHENPPIPKHTQGE